MLGYANNYSEMLMWSMEYLDNIWQLITHSEIVCFSIEEQTRRKETQKPFKALRSLSLQSHTWGISHFYSITDSLNSRRLAKLRINLKITDFDWVWQYLTFHLIEFWRREIEEKRKSILNRIGLQSSVMLTIELRAFVVWRLVCKRKFRGKSVD